MSSQQQPQKDMSGVLFENDRKQQDSHPDRQGTITIAGVQYRLSGWIKRSQNGKRYCSLAASPMTDRGPQRAPQQRSAPDPERMRRPEPEPAIEDEMPF